MIVNLGIKFKPAIQPLLEGARARIEAKGLAHMCYLAGDGSLCATGALAVESLGAEPRSFADALDRQDVTAAIQALYFAIPKPHLGRLASQDRVEAVMTYSDAIDKATAISWFSAAIARCQLQEM